MELTWTQGLVQLTQRDSIDNIIKEHEILEIPNRSIPLNLMSYTEPNKQELLPTTEITKYQSLIGSFFYINRMTRPEISVHVNLLVRRISKLGTNNLRTVKQLLQYLASTKTEELKVTKTEKREAQMVLYADMSYGGENYRSQSGSLVTLYRVPIMWNSRRQVVVSMSTTKAIYIACCETAKDSQFINQFLNELQVKHHTILILHTDNKAALKLTKTQVFR